ncbi:flagellar basal body-associated FliL family protein [Paracoccus spongiarum]|uniref:Flagellar protein FliL n=1 Tax=Paracoccus spongiarum TaxID=3064387 RepID=A0ABT9JFH2_9RHOB|nr:flagellar basal body-associated FliL family protein [Paracoccus sp. 2205BS29-5]MDP5308573.1 flagellar basal body-associated FliL family protein [Paracoccus sp. 2205BS29-5]
MSATAVEAPVEAPPPRKKKAIVMLALALALGGGGFASTYLGLWSPAALIGGSAKPDQGAAAATAVVFVDVPKIEMNIPGSRGRSLVLSAAIETDETHRAEVEHLMPRVLDAFTSFLSGIDPGAYDKRGVLEIIRSELVTRSRYVVGEEPVKDLLITEFLIR